MVKAFNAYSELFREMALAPADAVQLGRCMRFEMQWDTTIAGEQHVGVLLDKATAQVPMGYVGGAIYGSKVVSQTLTWTVPQCTTLLLSTPEVRLSARLDAPNLNFGDDELSSLKTSLVYDLLPGNALAFWRIVSCQGDPDDPPIDLPTSWVGIYRSAHFAEGERFRAPLRSGVSPIYGDKAYHIDGEGFTEDTTFVLRHTPQ